MTTLDALRACGACRIAGATSVGVRWSPGSAGFAGLQSCGSVWACPVCAARIAAERQREVGEALNRHVAAGGGIAFVTLTLRHNRFQALRTIWSAVSKCWAAVHGTAAWRGGARAEGDVARFGIDGWIRIAETTHGFRNGWHVHVHVAVLTSEPLTADRADRLAARMFGRWSAAAQRAGLAAPTLQHGVDVQVVAPGLDAAHRISSYLTKSGVGGVSAELLGGAGGTKAARRGNRTPWQIAASIAADIESGRRPSRSDRAIWAEWEAGSRGRRQIAWSAGLRDRLVVEPERDDAAIAADEIGGWLIASIPESGWTVLRAQPTLCTQLLRTVERAATPDAAAIAAQHWFDMYCIANDPMQPLDLSPGAGGLPGAMADVHVPAGAQHALWLDG